MNDELDRLNREADHIDARDRRDFARRVAAARDLRSRCAPYKAVLELEQLPMPVLVIGLSLLARRLLALVDHFVSQGAAGVQVGLWDLVYRYQVSLSTVRRARDELVAKGWLVKTPDYVPATETKLLGPYVSVNGKYRSLRSEDPDDPDAHQQSQVRNLYTLASKALANGLGKRSEAALATGVSAGVSTGVSNPETGTSERCGQLGGQTPDTPDEQATSGFLSAAVSGSDSGSAHPDGRRSCGFVDNSRVGEEVSSLRSDGELSASPSAPLTSAAPLVVDELVADIAGGDDDDGGGGHDGKSQRRGLFGAMGWRLSRFLRGGEA
jgi:hypothetical protein